jgi:hypothetical protein
VVGAHAGNGPWDNDLHHIGDVRKKNRRNKEKRKKKEKNNQTK